jgi:site-specific recombinase XerD
MGLLPLRELLGHKDVQATQIYKHVLKKAGVKSSLDA